LDIICSGSYCFIAHNNQAFYLFISPLINPFIYDKNNPKQLKEILEFAANSRSEIYKMGDKAYSTAKSYTSHYNIDCINQILKE